MASGISSRLLWIPLLLAGAAGGAYAQTSGAPAAHVTDTLEEVTVTAQRRSEHMQDVPISLDALTSQDVANQAIVTSQQLEAAVPALTWGGYGSQFGSAYIRGIGANNVLPGSSSDVPIYIDGALQISTQQANFGLYGLDRIEVLKGPQGTLFGGNASGGVINIKTLDPTAAPSAKIDVGYGNFNTVSADFYGNTGLSDTLSTNLAVSYLNQGEGWGKNLTSGATVYRERDTSARWKLRWTPNEDTSWILSLNYAKAWSDKNTWESLDGHIGGDGSPFPGWWNTRSGQASYFDREVASATLNGSVKTLLGEFISITSYSNVKEYWSNDVDGVGPELLYANYNIPSRGFTQEFRLVSPDTGTLKWVAGVFYQDNKSAWDPLYVTGSNLGGLKVVIAADLANQAEAAYGDLTWTFAPNWHATAGARISMNDEQVSGATYVNGAIAGGMNYQRKHFEKETWRAVIDHSFTRNSMMYASVSTGFNQGSFNSTSPGEAALEPETVTAYEVGFKSEWLDHRLRFNADVYYEDYKNLQTQIVTKLLTQDTNVGKVSIKGAEVELKAVPAEGLTIGLTYNYNDATYADFANAVCVGQLPSGAGQAYACDANGKQVQISPKNALGANITYDVHTNAGVFSLSATESYKSASYWDYANVVSNPARSTVDATLRYGPERQKWSISVGGRNLTNSEHWTSVLTRAEGILGTPGEPRTYAAHFEMRF